MMLSRLISDTRAALRFTLVNPILTKEMRSQMRGARAFWIITGYLLGLGLLAYGLYRIVVATMGVRFGPGSFPQSAMIGQILFIGLAYLELLFVCFITPALTASTISGEDERRTFDMLLATPLRPLSILWGKMLASLVYVQLLILAAVPLFSIVFLFGGVVLRDVVQAIGLLVLVAVLYGVIGVFFSALTRRTGRATVLSYLVVLLLVFGSTFLWVLIGALRGEAPPRELLYVNPINAMTSAIVTPQALQGAQGLGQIWYLLSSLGGGAEVLGLRSAVASARPVWQYTVAIYAVAAVVLYLVTTQLVKPVRRWRIGWHGLAAVGLLIIVMGGSLWLVFGTDQGSTGLSSFPTPTPAPIFLAPPPKIIVEPVKVREVIIDAPTPTPWLTPTPPPTPTAWLTPPSVAPQG